MLDDLHFYFIKGTTRRISTFDGHKHIKNHTDYSSLQKYLLMLNL